MTGAKRDRQSIGGCLPCRERQLVNQTPPMPCAEASHAPINVGACGTISFNLVGLEARSFDIQRKSSRALWTCWVRRSRCFSEWRRASCRWLKSPRPPGIPSAMLRSSPSNLCHFFCEILRFDVGTSARISWSRVWRWAGSSMVPRSVSTCHPRMVLHVLQQASPFINFFTEIGSFRCSASPVSNGRRTWSNV